MGRERGDGRTGSGDAGEPAERTAERAVGKRRADPERKVVTALVAGLVETAPGVGDPEDHIAMHNRMVRRIQHEVRRYGGAVHTVFGGSFLAVFGAERVREDDPERAVRAALAVSGLEDPAGLAVRVGVETGPAVVAAPAGLEPDLLGGAGGSLVAGVTGTALDVASTLGVTAAPGSVLVGPAAHQATARWVEYDPVRPGAWRPVAPRSLIGSLIAPVSEQAAPLVERTVELALLEKTLERVRQDLEPQLLTMIGAPGIGKSRLVAEFAELVDRDPELITWRQARSVPYGSGGEGVTLWALAEIARAQAGVLESDPAELVTAKLRQAVADVVADPHERSQIEQRLHPLVQVSALPADAAQRRQLVEGWVRFMGAVADDRPLVVVVEDLQWADSELLDCLHGLVDDVGLVPLLMVCTARPELLEHMPTWGGGKRNALAVSLTPLTEQGSGALLDRLLADLGDAAALPAATRARLLENAAGIPLYLEEYVRMLRGRAPAGAGGARLEDGLPLPETVQQIISARLDALPRDEKALLQDMAVLGEVGRRAPLVALTGWSPDAVDEGLARLQRHELLRAVRADRRGAEPEYAFRHALVRDVAYNQILRADRAGKHQRVAEWLAGARGAERAEEIAHHYRRALEFTRATGSPVGPLAKAARLAFRDAGDRTAALGALAAAVRYDDQALELWPHDAPDRAELLLSLGYRRAISNLGGETELLAARDLFEAAGDSSRAALASVRLALLSSLRGDRATARAHEERASRLVGDGGPPSRVSVEVMGYLASQEMIADRHEQAVTACRAVIRLAARVGAANLEAIARGNIGMAQIKSGDLGGTAELARAIAALDDLNHHPATMMLRFGRIRALWRFGDLAAAATALADARRAGGTYGSGDFHMSAGMLAMDAVLAHAAGDWDAAVQGLQRCLATAPPTTQFGPWCRLLRGGIRLERGDVEGAVDDARAVLSGLPSEPLVDALHPAMALLARALLAAGQPGQAGEQVAKLLADVRARPAASMVTTDLAVALAELGYAADAVPAGLSPTRWNQAARAFAAGDLEHATELYGEIGALPDQALARLYHARRLAGGGRTAAAATVLEPAIGFWERVGATANLTAARALLDGDGTLGDGTPGDGTPGDGTPGDWAPGA